MKKIALVGLIYDTNLDDPAIYESTRKLTCQNDSAKV